MEKSNCQAGGFNAPQTMRTAPYNARDIYYKSVFGAVAEGQTLRLRVLLPCDGYVQGVVVVFDRDGYGEQRFELLPDGYSAPDGFYTRGADVALTEGLYFYRFIMYTVQGERQLLCKGHGVGEFDPPGGVPWQLTVYESGFATPEAVKGGSIYQIFPDRFSIGGVPCSCPDDRLMRADWGGQPEYTQPKDMRRLGNDYFGGNLCGISEKLPYLQSLGVTMIYLNPIFEAHSNHRYNTADYFIIDPLLGTEQDFTDLCTKAKQYGIGIILDGVFSHTGDDSRYFNAKRRYGDGGAYNDPDSPYSSWYHFTRFPDKYSCWWGVPSLPEVNENDPGFTEFITGENGVLRYWLRRGASGFRLDVADELPDAFLDKIRLAVKAEKPDALLLGEVWEDASNKISYGGRRRFLRGHQLDSVMNYPFANAIIDFVRGGDGTDFAEQINVILENYPKPALDTLMNHIGTHDTARILTVLAGEPAGGRPRHWQAGQHLSPQQSEKGKIMLCMAAVLQYTLVGIPSLYYGDEAGLTGYGDPFCRACFPWGQADAALTDFYRRLGQARHSCPAFVDGELEFLSVGLGYVLFRRKNAKGEAIVGINRWCADEQVPFKMDCSGFRAIFGEFPTNGTVTIKAENCILFLKGDAK